MKLFDAIRKSDCNAAIFHDELRNWSWVVVAWPNSEYSIESHCYRDNGDIKVIVATFDKFPSTVLPFRLGKETYESGQWKSYNATVIQQCNFGRIKSRNVRDSFTVGGTSQNERQIRSTNIRGTTSEKLFGIDF